MPSLTAINVSMTEKAHLLLEDGLHFQGQSIGADGFSVGELVFNTAMTGYQEILTDPSYASQLVTLTYPHIGNTGINAEDQESEKVYANGLIINNLPTIASNWRQQETLEDYLVRNETIGLADIDTRKLTRHLRQHGAKNAVLYTDATDQHLAEQALSEFGGLKGADLACQVSTEKSYAWDQGIWHRSRGYQPVSLGKRLVVAYDFGIKRNILRQLVNTDCKVTVVPARTTAQEVMALKPDGIFLSNGPGDPQPCDYAITAIREFLELGIPLFGICLGFQLLGLACGAQTRKMKFGHHGANHPVLDLSTQKVMITSQNHGFCVDEDTLPTSLEATHRSLFDQTLQGIRHRAKPAFGFQGHPEASPGPHDIQYLFTQFADLMDRHA